MNTENSRLLTDLVEFSRKNMNREVVRECFSYLDVTTLDVKDTPAKVGAFTRDVLSKIKAYGLPEVATICVAPIFIEDVGVALGDSPVGITSVAGGFPTGETFLEVKVLECAMAIENGADEIDVVIDIGGVLEGSDDLVRSELMLIKEEIGDDALMKVIIESGELGSEDNIRRAARIAIEAGADFVKTSTGKASVSATPEAVLAICAEIGRHYEETSRMVGIKVAGGVSSVEALIQYYTIVKETLGEQWLSPQYFRIGASSLFDKMIDYII